MKDKRDFEIGIVYAKKNCQKWYKDLHEQGDGIEEIEDKCLKYAHKADAIQHSWQHDFEDDPSSFCGPWEEERNETGT